MYVVSIISKRDDKTYFNKCGVGFENRDGSINFKLDIFGDTQFHLRADKSDEQEKPDAGKHANRPR